MLTLEDLRILAQKKREKFVEEAMKAGFTEEQANFLYKTLTPLLNQL